MQVIIYDEQGDQLDEWTGVTFDEYMQILEAVQEIVDPLKELHGS